MPSGMGLLSENKGLGPSLSQEVVIPTHHHHHACTSTSWIYTSCNATFQLLSRKRCSFLFTFLGCSSPLDLFKCKRNYLNNVQSDYSLWWSVHKQVFNRTLTWLSGSFAYGPWIWKWPVDQPWSSLAIVLWSLVLYDLLWSFATFLGQVAFWFLRHVMKIHTA